MGLHAVSRKVRSVFPQGKDHSTLSENKLQSKLKDAVLLWMIMYQGLIHFARTHFI